MTCDDLALLLHASLDGELDAASAAHLERHLAGCPSCAAEARRLQALRHAIRDHATRHRLPDRDRDAIRRQLGHASSVRPSRARGILVSRRAVSGMAASLLVGLGIGGWLGPRITGPGEAEPALGQAIIDAHLRALRPGHAIDVTSSDRHTVKPWFDGRVDFSPPVKDLGEAGFALIGGRLDYVGRRQVAVIVYRRRQHQIDLFAWPVAAGTRPSGADSIEGYHVRAWTEAGFQLVAVSNLAEDELDLFVEAWREAGRPRT